MRNEIENVPLGFSLDSKESSGEITVFYKILMTDTTQLTCEGKICIGGV